MRILHICSGNLYGGVETIQVTLARYRAECPEIEPHFTVCFEGRLSQELRSLDAPVQNLGAVRVRNPISVWNARTKLRELLSDFRYDAAICHSAWTQAIFGPVVQAAGIRLLFWLHGTPSGQHWLERWAKRIRPERVICCSKFTASLLWKLYPGIPKEVVYAPVTPIAKPSSESQRLATRRELNTPDDAVVIIQVSRMEPWKGQRLHLEALAKIRHIPRWVCWFVGGEQRSSEARYVEELKQISEQYGIGYRLRFLGHRTDVPRLLHAADLFCQPNLSPEPFGIAFVEALLAGLPVITTAIGGGLEIIEECCGVVTPPNDAAALANALSQLIMAPEVRNRMSKASPIRARELCEPSRQLKRLTTVIERHNNERERSLADTGSPRRLLHIGSGNLYGGVESTLVTHAKYRNQFPHIELHFSVCFEGRLSRELRMAGVPVHNLGSVRIRNPISVRRARAGLSKLLADFRFDAAICHSAWSQAIFGPVIQGARVPLLFWLHGAPSGRHWLELWASRTQPQKVICCSKFMAGLARKMYPEVPTEVVYPPLALKVEVSRDSVRIATRNELDTPLNDIVIVQVSRMEPWKGQRRLIEALARMQDLPNWVCWFAGGPQRATEALYFEELRTAASQCGVADRVRFLGQRTDVERLLHAADVFCQPNIKPEPFGQAFVEALSFGLPVITSAMGGGAEILNSTCGVLIPPGDVSALGIALRRFVTDSKLRTRMSKEAPTRARELCEPSRQVHRLNKIIEETFTRGYVA